MWPIDSSPKIVYYFTRPVLAYLAQRVTFELVPGQEVVPQAVFAIRMKNGCKVVVRRREPLGTTDDGRWTMDDGRWTTDDGQ